MKKIVSTSASCGLSIGKMQSYSKTTINESGEQITENLINLQENRPIRGLNYEIPYQNWAMINRDSMKELTK